MVDDGEGVGRGEGWDGGCGRGGGWEGAGLGCEAVDDDEGVGWGGEGRTMGGNWEPA